MPLSVINNIKEKICLEFWEYVCEFWDSVPELGTLIKVTF
jgi:hypothetical protein